MGNRRKTVAARTAQFYRNAQSRMVLILPRRRRDGEWVRNEGHYNRPYGPLDRHSHTGVLALQRNRERRHRDYSTPAGPDLGSMNRAELRVLAKERGIPRYGKMTPAELREALT